MAGHFTATRFQIVDANGLPIAGAKLRFYLAGTTTAKDVYSDDDLTTPVLQPVTADAAGRLVRLFMSGLYKVRVYDSDGVTLIYEDDDCDFGQGSSSGVLAVSSGGTGAITADTARSNLGAASQVDMDAVEDSVSAFFLAPGGRLTLLTATPVIAADQAAKTTVFYTPYLYGRAMLYNGTDWVAVTFTETSQTLADTTKSPAAAGASNIYDMFLWTDAGTIRCTRGPAWTTPTAGSGARGTGAGTTELERVNGIYVNKIAITNGPAAQRGLYVGSIYVNSSTQVQQLIAYGTSREWGVWNYYNRVPIILQGGDATPTWNYNTNTIRQSRATTANKVTVFSGLAEESFLIRFTQKCQAADDSTTGHCTIGIGVNSTTAYSGKFGNAFAEGGDDDLTVVDAVAEHVISPALGIQNVNMCENTPITGGATNQTFYGGNDDMLLTARWMG